MVGFRIVGLGLAAAVMMGAAPASAQFFMKSKDLSGSVVRGDEAGIAQPLPGATEKELKAGLTWTLRAALNVAALQCQFEPTLLAVDNYNAVLTDHRAELKESYDALTAYFKRTNPTVKASQTALDQFGTRTYSSFNAVASQFNFCQTAGNIGRAALYTPRGSFGTLAQERMRELRNSLSPWGEQQFARWFHPESRVPRLDKICWSNKGEWQSKKCGALDFPPPISVVSLAQR
ncbi:hypothetical protein SPMU_29970 [Sphingomonas mucosissima]|uniref:Uncharacterized protein n=2 Tax=Sphingomonas mucosissima TaxID=370959 RepID=A0A245ZEJ8_9SPHN|nr:hypothetical protein [Sphingomonas mucosissima]OWK28143.1 hypothetical protein SPMU_29970 [Sphingomonas mucosissima]